MSQIIGRNTQQIILMKVGPQDQVTFDQTWVDKTGEEQNQAQRTLTLMGMVTDKPSLRANGLWWTF